MQAAHLVKETLAPNLTAGMMAGRIRGGLAHQWFQEHAETAKMKETTGKEYLLREFANLYEKSQPQKVITAWADVTSITLNDTKKNKPADDNIYEQFIREYKIRAERFKIAARGTTVSNTFPEPVQAINALWRLQLPPKELTRAISFMHEDVQQDMFKLTMAELQRVFRPTLVPNIQTRNLPSSTVAANQPTTTTATMTGHLSGPMIKMVGVTTRSPTHTTPLRTTIRVTTASTAKPRLRSSRRAHRKVGLVLG